MKSKKLKREEAQARQEKYNKLTFEQKLAKAGNKQRKKLLATRSKNETL